MTPQSQSQSQVQVLNMLVSGATAIELRTCFGWSDAKLLETLSDPTLQQAYADKIALKQTTEVSINETLQRTELKAAEQLKIQVESGACTPSELTSVIRVLGQRGVPQLVIDPHAYVKDIKADDVVKLDLAAFQKVSGDLKIKKDTQNRVVAVNDKPMITISPAEFSSLIDKDKDKDNVKDASPTAEAT